MWLWPWPHDQRSKAQSSVMEQILKGTSNVQVNRLKIGTRKPKRFNSGSSMSRIGSLWADAYCFGCLHHVWCFLHYLVFSSPSLDNTTCHKLTYFSGSGLKLIWFCRQKLSFFLVLIKSHIQQGSGVRREERSWSISGFQELTYNRNELNLWPAALKIPVSASALGI